MTRPAVIARGRQRHHSVPASASPLPPYTFPLLPLALGDDTGAVFTIGPHSHSDLNQA